MKQFLEYLVPNIVNHPEDVVITEEQADGEVTLTIKVHPEDTGRVIGKAGKIINSIRALVRVIAIKQGVRVNVEIADGQSAGAHTAGATAPEPQPETEPETEPEAANQEA